MVKECDDGGRRFYSFNSFNDVAEEAKIVCTAIAGLPKIAD
jgi:hypothetical protein